MAKKDIINNIFEGVERAMEAFKNYRKVGSASKFIIRDTHHPRSQLQMGKKLEDKKLGDLGEAESIFYLKKGLEGTDKAKKVSGLNKPENIKRRKKEIKDLTKKLGGEAQVKKLQDALARTDKAPYN